jgi:L-fuculose-phosphate aldolase
MPRATRHSTTALRRQIIATCLELDCRGLNHGTSGNVSARVADGFLLTPTALAYDRMKPADIVHLTLAGQPSGRRPPSSEWRFHLDLMRARPEVGAIIHTHSPFATTLACLRRDIPAFHYLIALFGGNSIRCSDYATYGTPELSHHILRALEGRQAALIGNHGLIVTGPTLERALALTIEAEALAAMYWRALQIGDPVILPDTEIERVRRKFVTYGSYGTGAAAPRG